MGFRVADPHLGFGSSGLWIFRADGLGFAV